MQRSLEGQRNRLFDLIGRHLVALAQQEGVPGDVHGQLAYPRAAVPAEYDSLDLSDDLHLLLAHWRRQFAPRLPIVVLQIDEISLLERLSYDTLLAFRALFVSEP